MTTAKSHVTLSMQPSQRRAPPTPDVSALPAGASGMLDPAPTPQRGKIEVSAHAMTTIAAQAACACYGVVGIAPRHPRLGSVQRLPPEDYARGVTVRFVDDHVVIDIWVILEHSLRVVEVAHNVMVVVKYAVEQALGLHVVEVNINVQALRVRG